MLSQLRDRRLFLRFFFVNGLGTIVDYAVAVLLVAAFAVAEIAAATAGFVIGTVFNYVGHTLFSYEHTGRDSLSILGYLKYLAAVMLSLVVRLAVVAGLGAATALPFWFVLIVAIGASFVASFVVATLWVFRKPEE